MMKLDKIRGLTTTSAEPGNDEGAAKAAESRTCICPYCNQPIETVLFRAEKAIEENEITMLKDELEQLDGKVLRGEMEEEAAVLRRRDIENELREKEPFVEKRDETLIKFWGNNVNITDDGLVNTVIREFKDYYAETAKDETKGKLIEDVKSCIIGEDMVASYERLNGYIVRATDIRGNTTSKRICSNCHCVLPEGYGGDEVLYFAVVGCKGSGKTVMLSKFLEKACELLPKVGVTATNSDSMNRFIEAKRVEEGMEAPDSTSASGRKPPIFMNIELKKLWRKKKRYTCVFYDIAGENCKNTESIENKAKYIKMADGIIMLVAPRQLEGIELAEEDIEEAAGEREVSISEIYSAIANSFRLERRIGGEDRHETKLAVTLSKSDVYRSARRNGEYIVNQDERNANICRNVQYKRNRRGFMIEQHRNLSGDVMDILNETDLAEAIKEQYSAVELFAVSTLGGRTIKVNEHGESTNTVQSIESVRLEEPFVWILHELGIVDGVYDRSTGERFIEALRGALSWILNN